MYKKKKIAVVIPAYNEEQLVTKVIRSTPKFVDTIVVIDDHSTDNTALIVQKHRSAHSSKVLLIRHKHNLGVGGAIATGYIWCRDHGVDVAVVMAGDGQMNPHDLPKLLDPVVEGRVDYTKGNRLVTKDAFQKIPKIRFFGNGALSLFTKFASGYWHVADSQTGYTAINARALNAIDWNRMYKRYGQPNDLLVRLNVENLRVMDVPVKPVYGVGEKSGIRIGQAIFTISSLLTRLFFWRLKEKYIIRNFHPLVFFYLFGFTSLILTLIFTARLFILWITAGAVPEITFLTCLFTFSIAFNAFGFAMWFDYEENKHLNPPMDTLEVGHDRPKE
jgi:glycosyltransferase involved in cell wall biosynthesis